MERINTFAQVVLLLRAKSKTSCLQMLLMKMGNIESREREN